MLLKTPKFWFKKNSLIARLLTPLSWLYAAGSRIERSCHTTEQLPIKVICVGNITLGGSGKTPTVTALAHIFRDDFGLIPHILSRGYGASIRETHFVRDTNTPKEVGDEPLILSKHAPTWISKDRVTSGKCALLAGANILLLDDGLQNPSLHKDIKILVVDGDQGFGNECVFPAGPLRMRLDKGINDVDCLILIHSNPSLVEYLTRYNKPLFQAIFNSTLPLTLQPIVAFAGIGYPEKFKIYLSRLGYEVKAFMTFPDHHAYTEKDEASLLAFQNMHGLPLVTTEKDMIKLSKSFQKNVHTLPITLEFEDPSTFNEFLHKHLSLS